MKRVFRITIILIPVVVISAGIGLWRHHYLKIMNAEPEKVFHIPGQSSDSTTDANTSKVKLVKREDNTDVMIQCIESSINFEKMDNADNSSVGTIFGDITEEDLPPEAAAALRRYVEIQSTSRRIKREELLPLVKEFSKDEAAFKAIYDKLNLLKQQRKEALEILAKYSDEAFNELQATIERENNLKRKLADLERESKEQDAVNREKAAAFDARHAATQERMAATQERMDKSSKLSDKLAELANAIPKMSPGSKEQEQAIEEMEQIRDELIELTKHYE